MNFNGFDATELSGTIQSVVCRKPNGWGIISVTDAFGSNLKVVGTFAESPIKGGSIAATGKWINHGRFGRQFDAERIEFSLPDSRQELIKYISRAFEGVGPATARKIVEAFGSDTKTALGDESRLINEAKIRPPVARMIAAHTNTNLFLSELGFSRSQEQKILTRFGAESYRRIITETPYRLTEIPGIGFGTADAVAIRLGFSATDPMRIVASMKNVAETRLIDGHTATSHETLIESASALLKLNRSTVAAQISNALASGALNARERVSDGTSIYLLPHIDAKEKSIARDVRRLLAQRRRHVRVPSLTEIKARFGKEPDSAQYRAIQLALTSGLLIITGGPGTGKTTLLKVILSLYREFFGNRTWVVAPTARAAKRVKEATGEEATTVHRLLKVTSANGFLGFGYNRSNKLQIGGDLLAIEEASMLDTMLAASLLSSVPDDTPVIILGDENQLESVRAGNVLADMIASGVPTIKLTTIHRTDEGSLIPLTAAQIINGEVPKLTNRGDVRGIGSQDPSAVAQEVKNLLASNVSLDDIGILSPMKKGRMGTDGLNMELQRALNADALAKSSIANGRKVETPNGNLLAERLSLGDRVMQTEVNDYDLEIFNGDLCEVIAIGDQPFERWIEVRRLDDQMVIRVPSEKLFYIRLAYANTIHKAQGSQYLHVLLVLVTDHYRMLNRRIAFTGWSRAMKTLTVIGESQALIMACQDAGGLKQRETGLTDLLAA